MSRNNGWIGVDLDGTLAYYDQWRGVGHIGDPIPLMLERVKTWLSEGRIVKIMTARISGPDRAEAEPPIRRWCAQYIGQELEVVFTKDYAMIELWDDRVVQVIPNTGVSVADRLAALEADNADLREQLAAAEARLAMAEKTNLNIVNDLAISIETLDELKREYETQQHDPKRGTTYKWSLTRINYALTATADHRRGRRRLPRARQG